MSRIKRAKIRLFGFVFRLSRVLRRVFGSARTVYVQDRVASYKSYWRKGAEKLGFQFDELSVGYWSVSNGGNFVTRINNYIVQLDDPVILNTAGDKLLTFQLLKKATVTIPQYLSISKSAPEEFVRCFEAFAGPYVVKPARGTSSGLGISTMLRVERDCSRAIAIALAYCDEAIIEEHIAGECYRLLYLGNKLLRAARRSGIRVVGDGNSNLGQLIETKSDARDSWNWRTDLDILHTLKSQQRHFDEVPRQGEVVLVRSSAEAGGEEVRTEYDEDVTHMICRELADECRLASQCIGSEFCGVDVITTDPSRALSETGGVIDEINTTPGLHHHYDLRPVARHAEGPADVVVEHSDLAALVLQYIAIGRDERRVQSESQ